MVFVCVDFKSWHFLRYVLVIEKRVIQKTSNSKLLKQNFLVKPLLPKLKKFSAVAAKA